MVQAVEAVCRDGRIVPLEAVTFVENEPLVIIRMMAPSTQPASTNAPGPAGGWQALVGSLKDSPHWNEDPITVQESLRDEWH